MRKLIKKIVIALAILPMLIAGTLLSVPPQPAYACDPASNDFTGCGVETGATGTKTGGVECLFGDGCALTLGINIALYVVGAISVVMLIIGGIRYTTSAGNDKSVIGAKNTIMYAVIGVIVSLLAYAVINFVFGAFKSS
ncbi:MAG: hypothetical protein WCP11_00535 [Candidatus Saccharibacteria bacterium]